LKILFLIPSLQIGGMERVMSQLLIEFSKKNNIEIHLMLYGKTREIVYDIPESIIIHKPPFKFNNSIRFLHTLKTLKYLRKETKNIHPDTILSFGEIWNNLVLLALFKLKYPIYISDRNKPGKSLGKLQDYLRRKLYPNVTGIIAQTKYAKDFYSEFITTNKISVIGNPIKILDEKVNIKKENIVLTVGRLIKTKHHDELIKLFLRLNKSEWKLILVGGDALNDNLSTSLQNLIDENKANKQVILAGQQTDVATYYRKSKIFAFTSSSEGFPNVIGEAMSAGLPVISFDCVAGPSDMIENNVNGLLIDLFNYNEFEKKLSLLMEDENLRFRLGEKAKESIKRFDRSAIADSYFEFITQTL